jgi:glycosyltransferase involved in cell wall biosynthesis
MGAAGAALRPAAHRAGLQPEALAPSALWTLTGRRPLRRALAQFCPDVVWATSPPVASHFLTAGLSGELTVPLVCELRDNWAGNPYYDGGGSILRRIEAKALAPAAAIVVVTPGMVDVTAALHPSLAGNIRLLPNGFDASVLARRGARGPIAPPVTLIHAGPVAGYPGRRLEPLLEALRRPEMRERFRLELVGPQAPVDAPGVEVRVRDPVSWNEAIAAQAAADVGVILYSADRTALGTKVFELLALGKPLLALVDRDNDLDRLLRELGQNAGCAPHDDPVAIAAALVRLVEEPPLPAPPEALAPYDRRRVAERAAAMLNELVA